MTVLSQRAFCFVAFYKMNLTVEEKIEYMEDCKVVCEQPLVSLGEGWGGGGKDREEKAIGGGLKRQKIQMTEAGGKKL